MPSASDLTIFTMSISMGLHQIFHRKRRPREKVEMERQHEQPHIFQYFAPADEFGDGRTETTAIDGKIARHGDDDDEDKHPQERRNNHR